MIALYVSRGGQPATRLTFERSFQIGAAGSEVVLDLDPGIRCAVCTEDGRRWWAVGTGIVLDGTPVPSQQSAWIWEGSQLQLGPHAITIVMVEPALANEPTEAALLSQILSADDASREVYADWLDERGHAARAEFLRLQQPSRVISRERAAREWALCEAPEIDLAWRRRVGRPMIAGCARPACPGDWGALAPTIEPELRNCDACRSIVRYCRLPIEVGRGGGRFVLDCRAVTSDAVIPTTGWLPFEISRLDGPPPMTGDSAYEEIVRACHPEVRGRQLLVTAADDFQTIPLAGHRIVELAFGTRGGGQPQLAVYGIGALGVARLSQRPHAVTHLLAHASYTATHDPATAELLARLLAEAFSVERRTQNDYAVGRTIGVVTQSHVNTWGQGLPLNDLAVGPEWRDLNVHAPRLRIGDPTIVEYCTLVPAAPNRLRASRTTVMLAPDHALDARHEELGELLYRSLMADWVVVGRPFVDDDGTALRAPLVRRRDWS